MPENRILGPWTGAVTANSATMKAFITKGATAHLTLTPAGEGANPLKPALRTFAGAKWEVVRFDLAGLQPNVEYRYTLDLDNQPGAAQSGRFQTFPVEDVPASFTFLCGGDAGGGILSRDSNHEVFDFLRTREVFDEAQQQRRALFFLHLGDMHYRDINSDGVVEHLEGYRKTLKRTRQAAFFRQLPLAYVWDDHDFCGNSSNGLSRGARTARLAYQVGIPHYSLEAGGDDVPIYQAFTVGRVRFLLTDTRSARTPSDKPDNADKSILGAAQKEWLERELIRGRDRYVLVVWVNSSPWLGSKDHLGQNEDGWANYRTERAELGAFIERERIQNVLMLCADAHMVALNRGPTNRGEAGAGGFPVFHAAPLDRLRSRKGGPYDEGPFEASSGQYGVINIEDTGAALQAKVRLTGKRMEKTLFTWTFTSPRDS